MPSSCHPFRHHVLIGRLPLPPVNDLAASPAPDTAPVSWGGFRLVSLAGPPGACPGDIIGQRAVFSLNASVSYGDIYACFACSSFDDDFSIFRSFQYIFFAFVKFALNAHGNIP